MGVYFLDSSGIVKRYVAETGTAWIKQLCDPASGNDIYTAHVTGAEAAAAVMRRVRRAEIAARDGSVAIADLQTHLRTNYTIIPITEEVVQRAITLVQQHRLRGYDAIQLAAALEMTEGLAELSLPPPIFISADNDLNAAATAEGLAVDNPNAHP